MELLTPDYSVYTELLGSLHKGKISKKTLVASEKSLGYVDRYETKQQKARDAILTNILQEYSDELFIKNSSNKILRSVLFWASIVSFGVLVLSSATVAILAAILQQGMQSSITILASLATIISTVITLPKMLLKYFFPADERQYLADIVKATQSNDLKTKKYLSSVAIEQAAEGEKNSPSME